MGLNPLTSSTVYPFPPNHPLDSMVKFTKDALFQRAQPHGAAGSHKDLKDGGGGVEPMIQQPEDDKPMTFRPEHDPLPTTSVFTGK